jgi:hypothetical protein
LNTDNVTKSTHYEKQKIFAFQKPDICNFCFIHKKTDR